MTALALNFSDKSKWRESLFWLPQADGSPVGRRFKFLNVHIKSDNGIHPPQKINGWRRKEHTNKHMQSFRVHYTASVFQRTLRACFQGRGEVDARMGEANWNQWELI